MHTRGITAMLALSLALGIGWYVAAQDAGSQPMFESGQLLEAEDLNMMSDGITSNTAAITDMAGATSMVEVTTFENPDETPIPMDQRETRGTAMLTRTATGFTIAVNTTGLTPGTAYSNWWVIFNNPTACGEDGCTMMDFMNPDVEASVLNATGRVADTNGNATFNAHLPLGLIRTNRTPGGQERHRLGPGLQNSMEAELHYVIRCHGPANANPGARVEQFSIFLGGCLTNDNPAGFPCFDAQLAVFLP